MVYRLINLVIADTFTYLLVLALAITSIKDSKEYSLAHGWAYIMPSEIEYILKQALKEVKINVLRKQTLRLEKI